MARKPKERQHDEVEFDFIKSNYFRVIRGDGAFGGLTPAGAIHFAIFSERPAIPTKVVHTLDGGALGAEIQARRETRKSIVREVEVDVVMEMEAAVSLRKWLDEKIEALKVLRAEASK